MSECGDLGAAALNQPPPLQQLCWSLLLDRAPLEPYVCGAACYQLPVPQLLPLCRSVLDVVRAKNAIFYSCQTVGHLSAAIRRSAQRKARENEAILAQFLRHWPEDTLRLERLQGLDRLQFLQEGHPERDSWTLMEMERCDLFVHRYAGKKVLEHKKQLLSAGCSLLRTLLGLLEDAAGGLRRLRHLDISARLLSWVELFAVAGIVHDAVPAEADVGVSVSLGLRMDLSEGRRMYARRLLKAGLNGQPAGGGGRSAARVRLSRVSVVSSGSEPAEHRRNLLLAGQLLSAVDAGAGELRSLSVQADGCVPLAWLAAPVRRVSAHLTELKLLLPTDAAPPLDAAELPELVSELRQLRRLEVRCQLRGRLQALLDQLPASLVSLALPGCSLTHKDLEHLTLWPHLVQLEDLDLSDCIDPSDENFQEASVQYLCIVIALCESLRTLVLDDCRMDVDQLPQVIRTIRTRETLERLSFAGCPDPDHPDELVRLIADVASLPRLRLLTLSGFCAEQIGELRELMQYWKRVTGSPSEPLVELRQRRRGGDNWEMVRWETGRPLSA